MASDWPLIPSRFDLTFEEFIAETVAAIDARPLQVRSREAIFPKERKAWDDMPAPSCNGYWMEFGVFKGESITVAAEYRLQHCASTQPILGFDTFTGLPDSWRPGFESGAFSLEGNLPKVPANVKLVKGLFNETLEAIVSGMPHDELVSYLNIDCDLYGGAVYALRTLDRFLVPGSIICFDKLINFPGWREDEIKALYEWVTIHKRQVYVGGALADPALGGKVVNASANADHSYLSQSVLTVVANAPVGRAWPQHRFGQFKGMAGRLKNAD